MHGWIETRSVVWQHENELSGDGGRGVKKDVDCQMRRLKERERKRIASETTNTATVVFVHEWRVRLNGREEGRRGREGGRIGRRPSVKMRGTRKARGTRHGASNAVCTITPSGTESRESQMMIRSRS